jgi:hypothetical protein
LNVDKAVDLNKFNVFNEYVDPLEKYNPSPADKIKEKPFIKTQWFFGFVVVLSILIVICYIPSQSQT